MNSLDFPEILDPLTEDIDFSEARATLDRTMAQATDLYNNTNVKDAGTIAIPAFVLGLVGGAVGSKVLKGTLGLGLGAVAVWWAYNELQNPPPKRMISPPTVINKIAQPPRKLEGCC